MLGLALGLPLPSDCAHVGVDLRQIVEAQLLQLSEEVGQHVGHGGRVVAGPVVVEGGQVQVLGHNVQLVLAQLRQQVLGQNQAVHRGVGEGEPVLPAAGGDKAHVEVGVVGGQGPVPGEGQKGLQRLPLGRGPLQHLIGDAGETDDLRG